VERNREMTTEHQATQEEQAYGQLLDEMWELLSEPARAIVREAQATAYAARLVCTNAFQWDVEYGEARERMGTAAASLTDREHKLLAKLWRAALVAAASVDSEDFETLVGYGVYRGNLHRYYRMTSSMIEDTLQERSFAEYREKIICRDQELPENPF
jgi:hypothetical protein